MSQWNTFAVPPYCKRAVMTFPIALANVRCAAKNLTRILVN